MCGPMPSAPVRSLLVLAVLISVSCSRSAQQAPYVKGYGQSAATQGELDAMKQLIAQAMEEGAMGLSTALLEPPSSLATTDNLVELAKVAKQYDGIYASHIRDEGERVLQAVDEAIQVGRGAIIPVDILHMKIFDPNRVIDRATFENPHQFPVGIEYVIVNGAVTVDREQHTGALAGRVIYGPGRK